MRKPESGFSIVELVIVVAIILVVASIGVPALIRTSNNYQLGASGRDIAAVLRQAQMKAVQTNQIYYVQYGGPCGQATQVCAMPVGRFVTPPAGYTPAKYVDPSGITAGNVVFNAAGPGSDPLNLGGPATPLIGFNARGVPCVGVTSPFVCTGPATFEWFLKGSGGWGAVTVTPAGKIRSWRESGQGAQGMWE